MPPRLKSALVAEMIGSFALTFIGILAIHHASAGAGLLSVAIAHGLILAIFVTATMGVSGGHLNPAVTASFVVTGKMPVQEGLAYWIAQLAGGVFAALAAYDVLGGGELGAVAVHNGTPAFGPHVTVMAALFAEIVATFLLVMAVWGSAVDARHPNVGGFAIGLTIAADILAIGPLTGGSMNPQRSFGPTFIAGLFGHGSDLWAQHWVYWVGPLLGGCLAGLIYRVFILPKDQK